MKSLKIGFIGTGNMAQALIKAILKSKLTSSKNIISSDRNNAKLKNIKKEIKINVTKNNKEVVKKANIIFLAVKPQDIEYVLNELKNEITKEHLVISIAAGITLKKLQSKLKNKKVVRVMPNTPCLVGEMAAAYSMGKFTSKKDKELVSRILNSAGIAFQLSESNLDAVGALSGSGPAFVSYLINSFVKAGIKHNIPKEIALKLAIQTFYGTGKMLIEKKMNPDKLIEMVASPKGTTLEGLKILNKSNLNKIIENTMKAAIKRSMELGK